MDFTGVSCELLQRFLECSNMRNIEVLSFMSKIGLNRNDM